MRITAQSILFIAGLLAAQTVPVVAQEGSSAPQPQASTATPITLEAMPIELLGSLMRKTSVEEFTAGVLSYFRNVADADGVLNAQVIAGKAAIATAEARADRVAATLRADLDDDGSVTRAEMEKTMNSRQRGNDTGADQALIAQQRSVALDRAMAPDTNADGVITFDEMRAAAAQWAEARGDRRGNRAAALLAMDINGDGSVTSREVRAAAQQIFASVDTDGDGEIGEAERKALAEQYQAVMLRQQQRQLIAGCTLPPAPEGARIVVLSAQRGLNLTTVSVAGQDETTWSGEVEIQPGDDKLWVVAAAGDPMIWRLTGAVDRVLQFVVIPDYRNDLPAAGLVGLAADRVTFVKNPQCGLRQLMQSPRSDLELRTALLRDLFGRAPDDVVAISNFMRVSLPDGKTLVKATVEPERPAAVPEQVWRSMQPFVQSLPVVLETANVVATGKAEPYEVLPEEGGLLQLLIEGAVVARATGNSTTIITMTDQGQVTRTTNQYVFEIVKPLARFPGGLRGGRPLTFQLAPGVPMPAGDPGRSCVRDSAGQLLAGMKGICER